MKPLLRLPIFQKLLYANLIIIAFGAIAGTVITVWHVQTFPDDVHYELIAFFIAVGVVICYFINRWILRIALMPLDRLQEGVDRVRRGETGVRIAMGAVSDIRVIYPWASRRAHLSTNSASRRRNRSFLRFSFTIQRTCLSSLLHHAAKTRVPGMGAATTTTLQQ